MNEWVELEFKNQQNTISLYVNGELVDTLGDGEQIEGRPMLATMMFPMAKIGSGSNAFIGYVDDVRLGVNDDFASTMELDYALWTASAVLDADDPAVAELIAEAKAVTAQYDPSADDITRLTAELNEAIAGAGAQSADYSRIEAYKNLVSDLSAFTEESAANVTRVLDSIRYGLPAELQDVVDGYESALVAAIDALETKPLTNLYYVDQSTMTATASSYQQDGSGPANVLDGNPSTMWHTDWNITTMPHWIDLEMSGPTKISGIVYTPRQTGSNGNLTKYEIQVLINGQYQKVDEGTLQNDSTVKEISFDPVTTTNVRLVYQEAVNNNGSAAELQVVLADIEVDLDGLQAAVNQAKGVLRSLDKDDYTAESWDAVTAVIAKAEELLAQQDPDANAVAQMIYDIQKALTELRLNDEADTVDKDELYALLGKYAGYNSSDYTAETWGPFWEAYEHAKDVYEDAAADQAAVNAAAKALDEAGEALVKASEPTDPSKPSGNDGQTTEKPPVTAVQTGVTETYGMIYAAMLLISSGVASAVIWRKRTER